MNDGEKRAKSAAASQGGKTLSASKDHDLVRELRESRRAALNLMEDAVEAREQAEAAMAELHKNQALLAEELEDSRQLQQISAALVGEEDVDALYSQILEAAMKLMHADLGSMQMLVPDTGELRLLAWKGFHPESAKFWSLVRGNDGATCVFAAEQGERVFVSDVENCDFIAGSEDLKHFRLSRIRAVQSTPLISRTGGVVGIISTHWHDVVEPSERGLRLLEVLARQAADLIERARVEEAMRASEEKFRTLSEASPALIWYDDADGNCVYVNQKFIDFSGRTRDELAGTGWHLVLHPEDSGAYLEEFSKARDAQREFRARVRVQNCDGEWRWLESFAQPLFGRDGRFVGHVGVSPDITDSVEAESRLRESRELFLGLIESAPFGVYLVDSEFRLAQVSSAAQKVFEKVRPLIGRDFAEVIRSIWQEPFATEVINRFRQTLETGEEYHSEETVQQRADVSEVEAYDWQIKRIALPDGTFGVVCYFFDLTDRRRAERELRWSEERLRLLTESFHDFAIFTTDKDGNVVTWNPGAEKIFGYPEDEMIGRNGRILFVPEDQEKGEADREIETARTKGRAADERWHRRKDGSRFYASGIMARLTEGDELIGYAKIARDLTKQKQDEEELRRQYDELESIVAGRTAELAEANEALLYQMEERRVMEEERFALLQKIVTTQEDERRRIARDMHDSLGQQLTALRLKIASLKEDFQGDKRLADSIERLQELGAKVDSEVNFLVWELRPTVLDDLGLVAAIEAYAREWTRHCGIGSEVHTGQFLKDRLDADVETNLYRILQEALNNTFKHSGARGVNVVLESRRDQIVMVVEDDGRGFDPEHVRQNRDSGRGLGLIGMRERAAMIGGKIEIESSPGSGTTVFVRIPIGKGK